jgi:hypothetical protein
MSYNNKNNNNNNGNLNRLNIPLPINFVSGPSNEPLLTPRSIQRIFLSNVNQHLPEHFDYQTYFNVHGLCGRRSVSPVYYNGAAQSMNLQAAFQSYSNNMRTTTTTVPSFNHFPSNYNPSIHYGISNTYSLVEPSTPNSLKIPTTPTRSKSLSPSLRAVIQPPRIRHKQNAVNANISLAASTTTISSSNRRTNEEHNKTLPIMTNNPPANQSPYSVYAQQQQQQKIQIQKPIAIVPCKPAVAQIPQPPQPKAKEEDVKSNILKRCLENKVVSIMKPPEEETKPVAKIIKFVRIMQNFLD